MSEDNFVFSCLHKGARDWIWIVRFPQQVPLPHEPPAWRQTGLGRADVQWLQYSPSVNDRHQELQSIFCVADGWIWIRRNLAWAISIRNHLTPASLLSITTGETSLFQRPVIQSRDQILCIHHTSHLLPRKNVPEANTVPLQGQVCDWHRRLRGGLFLIAETPSDLFSLGWLLRMNENDQIFGWYRDTGKASLAEAWDVLQFKLKPGPFCLTLENK